MNAFVIVLALVASASAGNLLTTSIVAPAAISYSHVTKAIAPTVAVAAVPAYGYGYGLNTLGYGGLGYAGLAAPAYYGVRAPLAVGYNTLGYRYGAYGLGLSGKHLVY